MPPCRVEHAALAVRADPRPRLARLAAGLHPLLATFEHHAVVVVPAMDVGFIPALEAAEALHHRVLRLGDHRRKHLAAVPRELGPHQLDDLVAVLKAERRAVERDETLAAFDEGQQPRFLLGRNPLDVGVQYQPVVLVELWLREHVDVFGVLDRNAALRITGIKALRPFFRPVAGAIAKEQQRVGDRRILGRGFALRGLDGRRLLGVSECEEQAEQDRGHDNRAESMAELECHRARRRCALSEGRFMGSC